MELYDEINREGDFIDKDRLVLIFFDVYFDVLENCSSIQISNKKEYISNISADRTSIGDELEKYIINILGKKGTDNYFDYMRTIVSVFENLIINSPTKSLNGVIDYIPVYSELYWNRLSERPLADQFIKVIRHMYSNDALKTTVCNNGLSYVIGNYDSKEDEAIPSAVIKNIDGLESAINNLINKIMNSDSFFKNPLLNMEREEGIGYVLEWIMRNATVNDLADIEAYLTKYSQFLSDNTFGDMSNVTKIGSLLDHDLFMMRKRSSVNYETPYYLAYYMVKDGVAIELPDIRFGIYEKNNKQIFNILATQTSQDNVNIDKYNDISNLLKKNIEKSKNFRRFNPMHVVSLLITFGLIKGLGISEIQVSDYFPLRFNRLALEERQCEKDLDDLQTRLVDKNIYNYLKISEIFKGISICDYVDNGDGLIIHLNQRMGLGDQFSETLYSIGYIAGQNLNQKNDKGTFSK